MCPVTSIAAGLVIPAGRASAQSQDTIGTPGELKRLSLEELLDINVTSVSRKPEKLSQVASAIQVITNDEIRRSGATSIPEALRLAPNLQVAQVGAHQWAISRARIQQHHGNKLLVLVDGRSVYTPLFSGVFWDIQDMLLEDVDRIEVISGPGGARVGRERGERRHQHHHQEARARRAACTPKPAVVPHRTTSPAHGTAARWARTPPSASIGNTSIAITSCSRMAMTPRIPGAWARAECESMRAPPRATR